MFAVYYLYTFNYLLLFTDLLVLHKKRQEKKKKKKINIDLGEFGSS